MIRDLYFTILVEVFTNHILVENTNRTEWTEHTIVVLKPSNKYQIIFKNIIKIFLLMIILSLLSKSFVNIIFYGIENNNFQKIRQSTIKTFIYYFIYSGATKAFCKIMQLKKIWFVLWYRNASFREIIIMCKTKYLNNKLRHFAKYLAKSFLMQNNSKSFSSL